MNAEQNHSLRGRYPLLFAVLPVILSLALICGVFVWVSLGGEFSKSYKRNAALSMSVNVMSGNLVKNKVLKDPYFVPFFGSSELRRFDAFHPAVLSEKYDRNYYPFLLGTAGTQSLIHYSTLHSMGNEMRGRKAVFILSPQWFTAEGMSADSFAQLYSPLHIYGWICKLGDPDKYDQYYAQRLLSFPVIQDNGLLSAPLEAISKGERPPLYQSYMCRVEYRMLSVEDRIFGRIHMPTRSIKNLKKELPDKYDADALDKLAAETGKRNSTNNDLMIKNSFYNSRLRPHMKNLKGSQKHYDYTKSPEFGDFQLVLQEMSRLDMEVLFIIPPVNGRWMKYTGLSKDMLYKWGEKIETQLTDQGFENFLNLQQGSDMAYFMQDTIHIGWRSWVASDTIIRPFLEDKDPTVRDYHTDTSYISKEWANFVPAAK